MATRKSTRRLYRSNLSYEILRPNTPCRCYPDFSLSPNIFLSLEPAKESTFQITVESVLVHITYGQISVCIHDDTVLLILHEDTQIFTHSLYVSYFTDTDSHHLIFFLHEDGVFIVRIDSTTDFRHGGNGWGSVRGGFCQRLQIVTFLQFVGSPFEVIQSKGF